MEPVASSPFAAWESFYVIVGSSAAALTGLQFVVIVLSAERRVGSTAAVRAFGTPTVVHFCAALLVSVTLSAPWQGRAGAALGLGACGVAGLIYTLWVFRHARRQREYAPVLEDWIWHVTFPLLAYAALLAAAVVLRGDPTPALFVIGATTVLLLFTGIHNAWDAVTYIAARGKPEES
jgi:hypothetical protein